MPRRRTLSLNASDMNPGITNTRSLINAYDLDIAPYDMSNITRGLDPAGANEAGMRLHQLAIADEERKRNARLQADQFALQREYAPFEKVINPMLDRRASLQSQQSKLLNRNMLEDLKLRNQMVMQQLKDAAELPMRKLAVQNQNALQQIMARQAGRQRLEGQRQQGRSALEGQRQEGRLTLQDDQQAHRAALQLQRLEQAKEQLRMRFQQEDKTLASKQQFEQAMNELDHQQSIILESERQAGREALLTQKLGYDWQKTKFLEGARDRRHSTGLQSRERIATLQEQGRSQRGEARGANRLKEVLGRESRRINTEFSHDPATAARLIADLHAQMESGRYMGYVQQLMQRKDVPDEATARALAKRQILKDYYTYGPELTE